MNVRSLFFLAPPDGRKSALVTAGLIAYGIGWMWLCLALVLQVVGLIVDGPMVFSNWPSSIGQWVIILVGGLLFYPVIGLVGFLLFRSLTYVLAKR